MEWQADNKILIQGIHHSLAEYYVPQMIAYGTRIVGGVSSGRGGESVAELPVFDLVSEALTKLGKVHSSLIFVPPYEVLDAALEAIAAGISRLIIVSAGVPPLDMVKLLRKAKDHNTLILGPGSSGLIIPGKLWLGTGFAQHYQPGNIGLLSRFSSLNLEVALLLNQASWGQSRIVDLGNADLLGSSFAQWLTILDNDPNTEAIALLGKFGSLEEMKILPFLQTKIKKPVITYFCGSNAPIEPSGNNAANIIANQLSHSITTIPTIQEVANSFKKAKLPFASSHSEIIMLLEKIKGLKSTDKTAFV